MSEKIPFSVGGVGKFDGITILKDGYTSYFLLRKTDVTITEIVRDGFKVGTRSNDPEDTNIDVYSLKGGQYSAFYDYRKDVSEGHLRRVRL